MVTHARKRRASALKRVVRELFFVSIALLVVAFSLLLIWVASLDLPDFNNFENRDVANSTKIYDRTGKIVLYNIHDNIKRTEVPLSEMSPYIAKATISIEDAHFYEHFGFRPTSFIRAVLVNVGVWTHLTGGFSQGGSTINQQV